MTKKAIPVIFLLFLLVIVFTFGPGYLNRNNPTVTNVEEHTNGSSKPIYLERTNDLIKVRSKYNSSQDIEVQFQKKGANNLFDISRVGFSRNNDTEISDDILNTFAMESASDFFGPHVVFAKENADGDLPTYSDYTGGNHAYNGDNTGTPTARTTDVKLLVDGEEVKDSFKGYADNIEISWTNRVQATNTKKEDGSGREVLEETFAMQFDGKEYSVEADIQFLEDVEWKKYYGMQANYSDMWNETILFANGSDKETFSASEDVYSNDILTDTISLNKGTDYLEVKLNNSFGIGDRELVNLNNYGAFNVSEANKAYFWLVDGAEMKKDSSVQFKGSYRFFSK